MEKRDYVPELEIYKKTLSQLVENNEITTLIAVRLGCEMGLTRIEIVNAKVSDIDRINKRGLWVNVAKRVKRKGKKERQMRQREIPINSSLYQLLKTYVTNSQMYILHRQRGDITKPFITRYINTLYEKNNIGWSNHHSRHYFKTRVWSWMMENQKPDVGLLKEYMGHSKTTTEDYGAYSWDYKRDVLDKVFE